MDYENLEILVFDANKQAIENASITVRPVDSAKRRRFKGRLRPSKEKFAKEAMGRAVGKRLQGKQLPKGHYLITVKVKGCADQERLVKVKGGKQQEIFILSKPGTPYLYKGDRIVPLEISDTKIGAILNLREDVDSFLSSSPLLNSPNVTWELVGPYGDVKSGLRITLSARSKAKVKEFIFKLRESKAISFAGALLDDQPNYIQIQGDDLLVQFYPDVAREEWEQILEDKGLDLVEEIHAAINMLIVKPRKWSFLAATEAANDLMETCDEVTSAEPNSFGTQVNDVFPPTDFYYPEKWDLGPGNVQAAWALLRGRNPGGVAVGDPGDGTYGNQNLVAAIFDSGIQTHTDIAGNMVFTNPDFNGTLPNGNPKFVGVYDFGAAVANNNVAGGHGNWCGGALGAMVNNQLAGGVSKGSVGVAPYVQMASARSGGAAAGYVNIYFWLAGFQNASAAPALGANAASIISCSWGNGAIPAAINDLSFMQLTAFGRQGRGTIVFHSAGNDNSPPVLGVRVNLARPQAAHARTLCIGGSTFANDGVTEVRPNYSGFGQLGTDTVDVVAPTHDQLPFPVFYDPPNRFSPITTSLFNDPSTEVPSGPASLDTTITRMTVAGETSIKVANSEGFVVGQQVLFGNPGPAPHKVMTITGIPGVSQLDFGAAVGAGYGPGTLIRGITNVAGNVNTQLTTDYLVPGVMPATTTVQVGNSAGFLPGMFVLIGTPGTANSELRTITSVPDATHIEVNPALGNAHSGTAPGQAPVHIVGGAIQATITAIPAAPGNELVVNTSARFQVGQGILVEQPGTYAPPGNVNYMLGVQVAAIVSPTRIRVTPAPSNVNPAATPVPANYVGSPIFGGMRTHTMSWGGTSHSTPYTAGIAAMMLSVNPNLTWIEVRQVLRDTADVIDALNTGYTAAQAGAEGRVAGWGIWRDAAGNQTRTMAGAAVPATGAPHYSEWYGFGRVNAQAAVQAAIGWNFNARDLMIRNWIVEDPFSDDNGVAATVQANNPVHSPDIWIRNAADPVNDALPTNVDGPHQNPAPAADRWIYVRVHNRGNLFSNLDAWVRVSIGLSTGAARPGITTPFLFPADWRGINPATNAGISSNSMPANAGAATTYYLDVDNDGTDDDETNIPPGTIGPNAHKTYRFHWRAGHVPPPGTPLKTYILVQIHPHDGLLNGLGAENTNNLTYREVMFAHVDYFLPDGTALPEPLFTDPTGGSHTQNFRVDLTVDIGTAAAEKVAVKLTRKKRDNSTESVVWKREGGVWQFQGGVVPAWATGNAPVVTGTANPAAGELKNITFTGTFDTTRDHNQVVIEVLCESSNSTAVIFKDKKECTITDRGLLVRDHLTDLGLVAVNLANDTVNSPDIWVRNTDEPVLPVPTYNADGPHENPLTTGDRFCYIRVKNMGVNDQHLAADVNFFIALSDGTNGAGINSPFLHPGDWGNGNAIGTINTDVAQTYFVGTQNIPAGTINLSSAADWYATDNSAKVFKFTWNQADLPPVGTNNKIFLLAEVAPFDSNLLGNGSENNRNLSFREIMFATTSYNDGSGGAMPTTVFANPVGGSMTQAFGLDINVDIGNVTSENLEVHVTRRLRAGGEETEVWLHNGAAWALKPGGTGWVAGNAPTITGTPNPAAGNQTQVSFTGTFDYTRDHDQVTVAIHVKGVMPNSIIYKASNNVTVTDRGLLVRDHLGDVGMVPTVVLTDPVNSPDLWIRLDDDPVSPPPVFAEDAPHENPNRTGDRWCYVRVKNMGVSDDHGAATVNMYVALHDGTAPLGIDTPFLHPMDWGGPAIAGLANTQGTFTLGSGALVAAELPKSNATAWDTTDTSVKVFKFQWDQALIPPVGTHLKIFLLAEIVPHEGPMLGIGAENNRSLAYREILFCDSTWTDGAGAALPASISADNLGNATSQNWKVDFSVSTGDIPAENVQVKFTRTNDNSSEDTAIFSHNGASWAFHAGVPAWASTSAPTVTGSATPAAGSLTDLSFEGSVEGAMQHASIRIEVMVKSEISEAFIAREWKDITVDSAEEVPIGGSPEAQVFTPVSHAFTDMATLVQGASLAYGPVSGSASTHFRTTSLFTSATVDLPAYAITTGIIMVQPGATADRVNVILKPYTQPGIDFTAVKYFIYRGLKRSDFINMGTQTKVRAKAGSSEFIQRLYDIHEDLNPPAEDLLSKQIGFDAGNQAAGDVIDQAFFEGDNGIQLPFASRGMVLGNFDSGGAKEFGIEIVLENGNYQPTFGYTRTDNHVINVAGTTFPDRLAREEVLNFLDPAAYYGMHDGGKIMVNGPDLTDRASMYTGVIDKFHTKNNLYLDIRNENGDSYNFYQNYKGPAGDPALGSDLMLGFTSPPAAATNHGDNDWPITIINTATAPAADHTNLFIKFRIDDNISPILYIERGEMISPILGKQFVYGRKLHTQASGTPWTDAMGFKFPNTGPVGAKLPIANVIKLHYAREKESGTSWPTTVVPTETHLDNIFGPLGHAMPWPTENNMSWLNIENKKFMDRGGSGRKKRFMAERGISFQGFDSGNPADGRVTMYAVADDYVKEPRKVTNSNGISGGVSTEASFLEAAGLFRSLKPKFFTIDDGGTEVTVFKMIPSKSNFIPPSSIYALGITKDEFDTLGAIAGFDNNYERTISVVQVASTAKYKKYKLQVRGLDAAGNYHSDFPASDIFVYTKDRRIFTSADYAQEEPLPSTYVRNYEEYLGTQMAGIGERYTISTTTRSSKTIVIQKKTDVEGNIDPRDIISVGDRVIVAGDPVVKNNRSYKVVSMTDAGATTQVVLDKKPKSDSTGGELIHPDKAVEDYCIDKDNYGTLNGIADTMRTIVTDFENAVKGASTKGDLETIVDTNGPKILNRARGIASDNGYANADDRILYWARNKMMVILKSHAVPLGSPEDREDLVERFDRASRGYDTVDFSGAPMGAKKILITGFDPFQLNNNVLQSNPSGAIALALHGKTIQDGPTNVAYVQAALLPVRYRDFDQDSGLGVVEDFYEKHINPASQDGNGVNNYVPVDQIFTVSQARPRDIWLDRYAARVRGGGDDNEGIGVDEFPDLPAGEPFYETTLDFVKMINAAFAAGSNSNANLNKYQLAKDEYNLVLNQKFQYENLANVGEEHRFTKVQIMTDPTRLIEDSGHADHGKIQIRYPLTSGWNDNLGVGLGELPNFANVRAVDGSGGTYLSNESYYRVARLCAQFNPLMKTGHLHVPMLQASRKVLLQVFLGTDYKKFPLHVRFPKNNTQKLIERVYDIFKDATN